MAGLDLIGILIGLFIFGGTAHAPGAIPQEKFVDNSRTNQPVIESVITPDQPSAPVVAEPTTSSSVSAQTLAQCLTKKGVIMYGAYWCPHCADQKKLFGDNFKLIKYQECDAKGENGSPAKCAAAKIEGYPTWIFPDQSRLEGQQTLQELAKKSNCL
jgi:glutaredoxin